MKTKKKIWEIAIAAFCWLVGGAIFVLTVVFSFLVMRLGAFAEYEFERENEAAYQAETLEFLRSNSDNPSEP